MRSPFPPWTNHLRILLALGAIGGGVYAFLIVNFGFSPKAVAVGYQPTQPVPFSHDHHTAGLGIDCRYCHTSVEESNSAGFPPVQTCMNCHNIMWNRQDMLAPVRDAYRAGESIEVAGHTFELRELRQVEGPNYTAIEGVVEIREDGDFVAEVRPQKRQYLVQRNWMTEAGINVHWNKDLFIALGDQLGNDTWSVRIQYKPMIRFIWLGCIIMALGGLIAVTDRRYRSPATQRVRKKKGKAIPEPA